MSEHTAENDAGVATALRKAADEIAAWDTPSGWIVQASVEQFLRGLAAEHERVFPPGSTADEVALGATRCDCDGGCHPTDDAT